MSDKKTAKKPKTSPDLQPGKVAVITGAGSGIGRALALLLAARGMKLALADRDEVGLAETVALIGTRAETMTSCFDVSHEGPNYDFAAAVRERFGSVDLVINNAGVAISGSVAELSSEEIGWIMGVNFWGVVHGTKAYLPGMIAQKSGTIVNVSSLFGLWAPPQNSAYASSKFAVRGFTESLRGEMNALEKTGVRVATVHPGGIATNIAKRARFAAASDHELARQRQAIFDRDALTTTPEEAARVIVAGLDAGKERILIGREAFVIDFMVRLLGGLGVKLVNASARRRMPKELRT
jgi:short-subunit dehydrogenase